MQSFCQSSRRPRVGFLPGGVALLLAILLATAHAAGPDPINPPLGPYLHPSATELARAARFGTNDPVVLTTYFYWYDVYTGAHIYNTDDSDALTDHPPP